MVVQPILHTSDDLFICYACGTQFPVANDSRKSECRICDDPRQFVPPEGQTFTTLAGLRHAGFKNAWKQHSTNSGIWSVRTVPQLAIGERAFLIQTGAGNILWDLISFLDQATVDKIVSLGGLRAIVISHPHFYSTWADWSRTFQCPVYVGAPDREWLERTDTPGAEIRFLTETHTPILPGSDAIAILAGGHFPGSLMLHWQKTLFFADTIFPAKSAMNPEPGKPGVASFGFFWSIPNHIPLPPDTVWKIWSSVEPFDFDTALGAFDGQDIETRENEHERGTGGVKGRLLQSCHIWTKALTSQDDTSQ